MKNPQPPVAFYAAYFANAWLRRIVTYVAVVYSFEVLGGGRWSGAFYLCLVLPYLLSVYAGGVIDVTAKRTVLRVTALLPIGLFGLAALADGGKWLGGGVAHGALMAALIGIYGVISAFAYPAFFAVIPDVVPREAVGRTTIIVNVLGMLCYACGPLVVGALHAHLGWAAIFGALAAVAVLAAGLVEFVSLPGAAPMAPAASSEWTRLRELAAHCRTDPALRALLLAVGVFCGLVVGPLEVLAPLYAKTPLGLDSWHAGLFVATGGLGLMLGAAGAMWLVDRGRMGAWLCGSGVSGTLLLVAMTLVPVGPAFVLFFFGGLLGGVFNSLSVAGLLARAPDALRGRVLGLYTLILGATPALGGLVCGALIDATGTVVTMRVTFGAVSAVFVLLYGLRPALRRA